MSEAPMVDPSSAGLLVTMLGGLGAVLAAGFGWLNLRINAVSDRVDRERAANAAARAASDSAIWSRLQAMTDSDTSFRTTMMEKLGGLATRNDVDALRLSIERARDRIAGAD